MKISLLNPQIRIDSKMSINNLDFGEHIGLGYLASYLRNQGHEVEINYLCLEKGDKENAVAKITHFNPDLIGFSLMSQTYPHGMSFAKIIKETSNKPIVVGGILPTILQNCFLEEFDRERIIDFLVFGDGEETLSALASTLQDQKRLKTSDYSSIPGLVWRKGDKIIHNQPRAFISNLDKLSFPSRDYAPEVIDILKKHNIYPTLRIISSRGCLGKCLFCHICESYKSIIKKQIWRYRSPENIIEEMAQLKIGYSIKHILFSDDNFFGYGKLGLERAQKLAKYLIRKKLNITFSIQSRLDSFDEETFKLLKDAGLLTVDFGVETINPSSLRFFQKGLDLKIMLENIRKIKNISGIAFGFYMLNIHPLGSVEETRQNFIFLKAIGAFEGRDYDKEIYQKLIASKCEVTKYTRMYYKIKNMGLLNGPYMNNPVMYHFHFKDETMRKFYSQVIGYIHRYGLKNFANCFTDLIMNK